MSNLGSPIRVKLATALTLCVWLIVAMTASAQTPSISCVGFSWQPSDTELQNLQITIIGTGFGTWPTSIGSLPFSGDTSFFLFTDGNGAGGEGIQGTSAWNGGNSATPDAVTMLYQTWTPTEIIMGGFTGSYLNPWVAAPGDPITLTINDPQSNAQSSINLPLKSGYSGTCPDALSHVSVADVAGAPGRTVTIEIDADASVQNVASAALTLQFGAIGTASATSVASGSLIHHGIASATTQTAGQIVVNVAGTAGGNGPGSIATFQLTINPTATAGTYPLSIVAANLYDPNSKPIQFQPRPELPSGTLTIPLLGDANGDGMVNIADVTLALRFAVGLAQPTPLQIAALDFSGNGKVTVGDVVMILEYVTGVIPFRKRK